jgi:anti-sigma regulatory factor (Ser/Thr protein kinase)
VDDSATTSALALTDDGFCHLALFYASRREYLTGIVQQVRASLDRAEPVFVAVPGPRAELLRDVLNGQSGHVVFADMTELGRNPARIIPKVRAFIDDHPGQRVSYVGEPIWPSRSAAELREAARHEALVNLAFSGAAATIMCPYAVAELAPAVLADARRTHPALIQRGRRQASPEYSATACLPSACELPLSSPPAGAACLSYSTDLSLPRRLVTSQAALAGLPETVTADLVLAVGEITANTLRHTKGGGTLNVWHTADEVICQVDDNGRIADPLAGRRRLPPDAIGGHGLWVVNQVCDLVEIRSGQTGTTIRLHMRRP